MVSPRGRFGKLSWPRVNAVICQWWQHCMVICSVGTWSFGANTVGTFSGYIIIMNISFIILWKDLIYPLLP